LSLAVEKRWVAAEKGCGLSFFVGGDNKGREEDDIIKKV